VVAQSISEGTRGNAVGQLSCQDILELALDRNDALFVDFDGTLAELGPDPDSIWLADSAASALSALAGALDGAVAILSGRDLRDLAGRTPSGLWRAGGHGLEILAPGLPPPEAPAPPPDDVLEILRSATRLPGVRLETKGPVAALHFRAAPDAETECLEAARAAAATSPDLVMQAGKMVVEVKPSSAHKGLTLEKLAGRPPFAGRRPVMFGDDTTDEDAIRAAQELGGLGVKVGDGESAARFRASDPAAVRAWLSREARCLAQGA
jgi:trehalose 6-phosphate phosphatase